MSIGAKIRTGALWMFMGKSGSQILSFAFGIVLARQLAPEVFGMLLIAQVFTGVASFVAGAGMGQALIRAKDTTRADYDIVFTLQLIIGCVIYAIFFVTAPWIADAYEVPLYSDMIRVMALSFIFRPFTNVPASILQREMRFKGMTVVSISSLIISSLASITMAYAGFGVWSLILGGLVSPFISVPAYSVLAKWRPGFSLNIGRAKDIARYGMWVSITDILVYLRGRVNAFIMSFTLGPAAVGLFNKGESLSGMPHAFITASVYQVLFRALAAEQDNLDKCRYLFFRSIALVAVYGTPFYVGLLWVAEPLVRGLYGDKWIEAAAPLFILSLAWPMRLLDMLSGAVLAAFAWLHRETLVQSSTLIVGGLAVLISLEHGIVGVAWAMLATAGFAAIYMYHLAATCLRTRKTDLLHALVPAIILNSILAVTLVVVDALLPESLRVHDLLYVGAMSAAGGFVYGVSFLFIPIADLKAERDRWMAKLAMVMGRE